MSEQKDILRSMQGLLGFDQEATKGKRKHYDISLKIMCLDCMKKGRSGPSISSIAHEFELNFSSVWSNKKK